MLERARSVRTLCAGVAVLLAATGCGNLTAGGFGDVVVEVSGDSDPAASPASPAASAMPVSAFGSGPAAASGPSTSSGGNQPEGEVEVELDLFLVSDAGVATQLNGDRVRVRVDLRGRSEAEVVQTLVEATGYSELRMVFTEIRADVESGLIIGGLPVLGEVRVELDDIELAVSRPLGLVIGGGQRVSLLIDLNAAAWLEAVDPLTKTVDAAVFADLIAVEVR